MLATPTKTTGIKADDDHINRREDRWLRAFDRLRHKSISLAFSLLLSSAS